MDWKFLKPTHGLFQNPANILKSWNAVNNQALEGKQKLKLEQPKAASTDKKNNFLSSSYRCF